MEWATDAKGGLPARGFYQGLDDSDKAKVNALFQRLAETGRITNREKFKSLGAAGGDLFEFKSFQVRFLGDFRRGCRFLLAHGVRKKKDKLDPQDIAAAKRVLDENDDIEGE